MHHINGTGKAMRYDTEHKEQTRKRVLKEAAKAIRAEGPHKIGVAGVMARAGLTHGGFYAHFASKDDFVACAIEQMFDEGAGQFARVMEGREPAAGLAAYIDFYLSEAHRDARSAGCPLPFLAADAPRLPEPARACYAQGLARLMGGLVTVIARVGLPEPESEASSVIAELVGALGLARAEPDPVRSQEILNHSRAALKRRLRLEALS